MRISLNDLRSEYGFSLLETLVALVILSTASLALFQGTATMLRVSDSSLRIGDRVLEGAIERKSLEHLIDGLVPNWRANEENAFKGDGRAFSGMSTQVLTSIDQTIAPFYLSLIADPEEVSEANIMLVYREGQQELILQRQLPLETRFEYLGVDQKWYDIWPPETRPERGFFEYDELFSDLALPEAIRMSSGDVETEGGNITYWVISVSRYKHKPIRAEL